MKPSAILFFFLTLQSLVYAQQQKKQVYQLDTQKSKILWNTGKLMGGHSGYILFRSGSLQVTSPGEFSGGAFIIDMNTIHSTEGKEETQRQRVDTDLRKPDFFSSVQFPTATVNVRKITRTGDSSAFKVSADLTIKGLTNPIDFIAKIDTKADNIYITAHIDLRRILWNIHVTEPANKLDFITNIKETTPPDIHVSLDMVHAK